LVLKMCDSNMHGDRIKKTRVHVKRNLENFVQTRRGHLSNASSETVERMESISLHRKVKGK
jgi:hypothetical protein